MFVKLQVTDLFEVDLLNLQDAHTESEATVTCTLYSQRERKTKHAKRNKQYVQNGMKCFYKYYHTRLCCSIIRRLRRGLVIEVDLT